MEIILIIGLYIFLFIIASKLSEISNLLSRRNTPQRNVEPVFKQQVPPTNISQTPINNAAPQIAREHEIQKTIQPKFDNITVHPKPTQAKTVNASLSIGNWIAKIGVAIFLIGIIFLTIFAYQNEFITAEEISTVTILVGIAISLSGLFFERKNPGQCMLLTFVGIGTSMVSIVAARFTLDFIQPQFALVLMFILVTYSSAIALRLKYYSILHFCILFGALLPFLTNSPAGEYIFLFYYLSSILAGAFVFAYFSKKFEYIITAIAVSFIYFLAFGSSVNHTTIQIFIYIYSLVFLCLGIYGSYIEKATDSFVKTLLPPLTILFFLFAILNNLDNLGHVVIAQNLLMFGLFTIGVAGVITYLRNNNRFANTLFLSSTLLLIFTILYYNLGFSPYINILTLNTALFELLILLFSALFYNLLISKSPSITYSSIGLLTVPLFLFGLDVIYAFDNFDINHLFISILFAIGLFAFYYVYEYFCEFKKEENAFIFRTLLTIGGLIVLYAIWYACKFAGGPTLHMTLVLSIYTTIGIVSYIWSELIENKYWNLSAILLLIGVIGRLLIVEIWYLDLGPRIFTFLFIGAVLIASSFVPGILKSFKITRVDGSK